MSILACEAAVAALIDLVILGVDFETIETALEVCLSCRYMSRITLNTTRDCATYLASLSMKFVTGE